MTWNVIIGYNKKVFAHLQIIITIIIIIIMIMMLLLMMMIIIIINPWRYRSGEPRPTEAVAATWQYRGPCG